MYTRAVLIAGSLMLASAPTSAFAADIYAPSAGGLKDPVFQEEVILPEAAIFQEYAEWYVRADIGMGVFSDMDGKGSSGGTSFAVGALDFDTIYSAGIGFGRYFTPNVRLGVDLDYRHQSSSKFSTGNPAGVAALTNLGSVPVEVTSTSVMVNAVYDFAPNHRFSPYLGGGVGVTFHNLELKGSSYTNGLGTGTISGGSSTSNSFAANLMAGVSVNIRQGLFLDVGYKFSYLGDASTDFNYTHPSQNGVASIDLDDIMVHEFKVGLRYDLY